MPDTLTTPRDRTDEVPQHATALKTANVVRLARAGHKRRLTSARNTHAARAIAAELLDQTPSELVTMTVRELLLALPRVGERAATTLVTRAGLTGAEQLGDGTPHHGRLTPRQRRALAGVLLEPGTPVGEAA